MEGNPQAIHVLIADDDQDDCFLFQQLMDDYSINVTTMMVNSGERLMKALCCDLDYFKRRIP